MKKNYKNPVNIIEVYEDNFITEIKKIGTFLEEYNYIGMDTEFPGIVYSIPNYSPDFYYKTIKLNVDSLKLIQLGVTLSDENGDHPKQASTWQFNLCFDYEKDKYASSSFAMLSNCGIDFNRLKNKGISHTVFAEYLIVSGLVLNPHVHWISFHGSYDFAYLLKILISQDLPDTENEFTKDLITYFPNHYDIRILVQGKDYLKGGLNRLAQFLEVLRVGKTHQAGSDSVVTSDVFFKLIQNNMIDMENLEVDKNILFGLGKGADDNETITYTPIGNGYYNTSNVIVNNTNGINAFNNGNMAVYTSNSSNGNPINHPGNFQPYFPNSLSIGYPSYFPQSQIQANSQINKTSSNHLESTQKNIQSDNSLIATNGNANKGTNQMGGIIMFGYQNSNN